MKFKRMVSAALVISFCAVLLFACQKAEKPAPGASKNIDVGSNANEQQVFLEPANETVTPENPAVSVSTTTNNPVNAVVSTVPALETAVGTVTETVTPPPETPESPNHESPPAAPGHTATDGFVRISGGTFTIGSPVHEQGRNPDESPQIKVTVNSFHIARSAVTQAEYEAVMGTNPSHFRGPRLPVEQVEWYGAVEFCNRLSQRDGLTPAYTVDDMVVTWNRGANGYRLPTEAEWEYACRGGTTTPFSTGAVINTEQANYDGNNPFNSFDRGENRQKTTVVGSFAPNPYGLYDMHGNVYEWCWDWYGIYPGRDQENYAGAASGTKRVLRGGSWMTSLPQLRSACRFSASPEGTREPNIGFRLARSE